MTALLNPIQSEWLGPVVEPDVGAPRPSHRRRLRNSMWPWVALIAAGQFVSALWPHRYNLTPFEDEGLYTYEGHRMIAHLLHHSFVTEYPGSYFSGAPGVYPVLAAIGDHYAGINGARFVSLLFAVGAMIGTCGLGAQLFGKAAGIVGGLAFALNGSVIYLSHWATYDSMMMCFVALAAWMGVWSANRTALMWTPAVSVLLTTAFLAKYAGAVYFPVVAALVAAAGWRRYRWVAVRQAAVMLVLAVALTFAVLSTVGRSMFGGIEKTTITRQILTYGSTHQMIGEVRQWIGPWLLVAAIGAFFLLVIRPKDALVVLVLAGGSIVGIAQQIHIHELTSFSKHVAFGLIFACPLIGALLAHPLTLRPRLRWRPVSAGARVVSVLVGLCLVAGVAGGVLQPSGWSNSKYDLTAWSQDQALVPVLEKYHAMFPNKHLLGDAPSPERYEMRNEVTVGLWNDTYVLYYKKLVGLPAYHLAISEDHFGVIYLTDANPIGRYVHTLLKNNSDYVLRQTVRRYLRGRYVGYWLVFTLRVPTTDG